jgi:hypothetical protein
VFGLPVFLIYARVSVNNHKKTRLVVSPNCRRIPIVTHCAERVAAAESWVDRTTNSDSPPLASGVGKVDGESQQPLEAACRVSD